MWVVPSFDGDVGMEVAKKQHDVYGPALWIIVRQCNLYAEFTRRVLDDADHLEWGTVESFDHRTLQGAHDLLAAVWRFRNDFQQPVLPFVDRGSDSNGAKLHVKGRSWDRLASQDLSPSVSQGTIWRYVAVDRRLGYA